ncbi:MAG: SIMPL domain-containing protein [Melioribacteraceae bacterium]|nr:SIMPL domain-containing protein [Melioribacteraceae bacterium]
MDNSKNLYLSIAIIVASLILGLFFYLSRQDSGKVRVVGYSVESFESDIIRWSFSISEITTNANMKKGYKVLNSKLGRLKDIISNENLEELDILYKPIRVNDIYDRNGVTSNKKLSQEIVITSTSIKKIEELSKNPEIFIQNSLLFEYSNIEYYYTRLDMLKKELLGKAIINAKERATEILNASGNDVGKLLSARSGVFQITEPLSTEVAGYGLHSTSTKKKNIKVTVSAEFSID